MTLPYNLDLEPTEQGLFDIPDEIYFRIKACNMSTIKNFKYSPAHVWVEYTTPHDPSYAMEQGTGFHWAALQPEKFKNDVVAQLDAAKNSKKYKNWAEEQRADGKLILAAKDIRNINNMVRIMRAKKSAMKYIANGWPEKAMLWYEPQFDIWCKGKVDWIREDGDALVDLKKTQKATQWAVMGAINRYGYNFQAFHYMRGFETITGKRPSEWVWIFSEIDPPNECNTYVADPLEIEEAEYTVLEWYDQWAYHYHKGDWFGYADDVIYLGGQPINLESDIDGLPF
jgi:hypothetical protein